MRAGAQPLSPNLLNFTELFYQSGESPERSRKTLGSAGGDTLWTKVLEKLNYYVRENPGEVSAF